MEQGRAVIASMPSAGRDRTIAALAWLAVLLTVSLAAPARSHAHASLTATTPAPEAVLDAAPSEVRLQFSGMITARREQFTIVEPDGRRLPVAAVTIAGSSVTVELPDEVGAGTHTLDWTVASDHGDAIRGLLPFHVGQRTGGDADARAAAARDAASAQSAQRRNASWRTIAMGTLLVVAAALAVMARRPAWRLPAGLAILVAVVLAAGIARRAADGEPTPAGTSARAGLTSGETLTLTVTPATTGANDVVLEITGDAGDDGPITEAELRATPADGDLGPMRMQLERDRDGRFVASNRTLPVPGSWSLAITTSRASGSGQQVVIDVPIEEPGPDEG